MPIDSEIANHIRAKLNSGDERLIREREVDQRNGANEVAARGLANSGMAVGKHMHAYGLWIEKRVAMYLDTYLETLHSFNIPIDADVMSEVERDLRIAAKLRVTIPFPPMLQAPNRAELEQHVAREMDSKGSAALSIALTRLREAKLLAERRPAQNVTLSQASTHISQVTFTGHNSRLVIDSVDNSHNSVSYDAKPDWNALMQLSSEYGSPESSEAAKEATESWHDVPTRAEKLQRWVTLASSSAKLMASAGPYLHRLYTELSNHLP